MAEVVQMKFGPRHLKQDTNANKYVLATEEWIAIQTYVEAGLRLPCSESEFKVYAKLGPSESIPDLKDIYSAYTHVRDHCHVWKTETFPQSVSLASDILSYNNVVKNYYPRLKQKIEQYVENPTPSALKELTAIIDMLIKKADKYAEETDLVEKAVTKFADETAQDKAMIDALKESYDKQYGDKDGVISSLETDIDEFRQQLEDLNKEYNKYVIVASTTPAYLVIPFIGWIAGAIVAGVTGSIAKKLKDQINELKDKIAQLENDKRIALFILSVLSNARTSIKGIQEAIEKALPALQKAKASWKALKDDLHELRTILQENIADMDPDLWSIGIDVAFDQWALVAKNADDYRHNAYIDIQSELAVS